MQFIDSIDSKFMPIIRNFDGLDSILHVFSNAVLLPPPGRQHSFVETDHEIFSTVMLSLLLIQEGQLSVIGKRMYSTGLPLRGLSLPSKSPVR